MKKTISFDSSNHSRKMVEENQYRENDQCLEDEEERIEMKKNYEKAVKENRNLTKEVSKLQKKADRMVILEHDKRKL